MRLFTAVELRPAARAAVAAAARRIRDEAGPAAAAIRWVREEHLHLTLVFLGEVPPDAAGSVVTAMDRPLDLAPFDVAFAGLGVFPPHGAPRVLWLGVGRGADAAGALRDLVADRLRRCGLDVPREPFHPHLTLGRWKRSRPRDRAAAAVAHGTPVTVVTVRDVTLFESRLTSDGPVHLPLARAPLESDASRLH
jgi:2'-5' RNA ligase